MSIKQVIVMRKDLNMRKGKMIAQGAHASMMFLTKALKNARHFTHAEVEWVNGSFTKICVSVDSEQELYDIKSRAVELGVNCDLVLDNGQTEFKEPTYTCLALGPDYSEKIDLITGRLKLL